MSLVRALLLVVQLNLQGHVFFSISYSNVHRGNATDLSLLPTMAYADIQKLQSVGKVAQAESKKFILINDLEKVWEKVRGLKNARVDIVLDNCECQSESDMDDWERWRLN